MENDGAVTMKRTNVFLAEEDRAAIENIQSRYGLSTSSDAIRFALRIVARAELQVNDRQLKLAACGDNSASPVDQPQQGDR